MQDEQLADGMWDITWNINSGKQVDSQCHLLLDTLCRFQQNFSQDHVGVGAAADSGVQYFFSSSFVLILNAR